MNSNLFSELCHKKDSRTGRISSWDHSGKNEDAYVILPGEEVSIADIKGPGCITHLWFVQTCTKPMGPNWEVHDEDFYRKIVIKMYWDGQETPSVVAPLGDFFCVGNSMVSNFQSLPFTVSVKPSEQLKYGGDAAMNCYLQMPFNKRAKIVLENEGDHDYVQYFYIDYELYKQPLGDDILYFHSHWRRENITKGWGPNIEVNTDEVNITNLDGKDNYLVLETEGEGQYIGMNHSITHFQGTWWGEGDDMIWIDDDPAWPPSIHGTGGEDYLGQGWMMQKNCYPFNGSIIHEDDVPNTQVSYRWHLVDPVRFKKKIKVTLEHGHANHLSDDWATTAYWYQTLPSPKLNIPPMKERLVRRPILPAPKIVAPPLDELTEAARNMHITQQDKYKKYLAERDETARRRAADTKERIVKNEKDANDVRERFLL